MRIGPINNSSFQGLIKFENKTINPNQIVSIKSFDGKGSPKHNKISREYLFTMSNGEKYKYHAFTNPGAPQLHFEKVVNQAMNSSDIIELEQEIVAHNGPIPSHLQ